MRIVCIDNYEDYYNITIGKTYDVIDILISEDLYSYEIRHEYAIKDNDNLRAYLPEHCFISISEYRNDKIDKLLAE